MRHVGACLLLLLAVGVRDAAGAAARRRRARPPPGPKDPTPTIGDALEINADPEYLGKDWQAVCVLTPGSANRRIVKRDGTVEGMRRRRGLITWIKKHEHFPWENPWKDPSHAPFKVRYLKEDPRGIAMSMAQEKNAELRLGTYKKRTVIGLSLAKPRAWWKFWPAPEDDE